MACSRKEIEVRSSDPAGSFRSQFRQGEAMRLAPAGGLPPAPPRRESVATRSGKRGEGEAPLAGGSVARTLRRWADHSSLRAAARASKGVAFGPSCRSLAARIRGGPGWTSTKSAPTKRSSAVPSKGVSPPRCGLAGGARRLQTASSRPGQSRPGPGARNAREHAPRPGTPRSGRQPLSAPRQRSGSVSAIPHCVTARKIALAPPSVNEDLVDADECVFEAAARASPSPRSGTP